MVILPSVKVKGGFEMEEKKETVESPKKVGRREALKRMAKIGLGVAGSAALLSENMLNGKNENYSDYYSHDSYSSHYYSSYSSYESHSSHYYYSHNSYNSHTSYNSSSPC